MYDEIRKEIAWFSLMILGDVGCETKTPVKSDAQIHYRSVSIRSGYRLVRGAGIEK